MSVADVASLPAGARAQYFGSLPASQAQSQQAAYKAYVKRQNQHYLAACYGKRMVCPPTSGGTTWNYTQGPMVFEAPVSDGAFIKELLITLNLTVACAAGTGATYAANPAAPYSLFDLIKVELNNEQVNIRPVVYKYINRLMGYGRPSPGDVFNGQAVASVTTNVESGTPTATGNNTWNLVFRVPLNATYRRSAAGLLPAMSDSTRAKITLVGAATVMGNDALSNAVAAVAGTGNAVTVTGTVKCEAIVLDGSTKWNDRKLRLYLDSEPTVQAIRDLDLLTMSASTRVRQKISTLLEHYYVLSFVVDAVQANKYAAVTNIQRLALNKDQVGQNRFWEMGSGTDQSIYDYYEDIRFQLGQDFDEGVVLWNYAPSAGTIFPGNNDGIQVLNMTPGGFVNVSHEYLLGTIGALSGVTPRVETYLISLNRQGLQQVQTM